MTAPATRAEARARLSDADPAVRRAVWLDLLAQHHARGRRYNWARVLLAQRCRAVGGVRRGR